MIPDKRKRTNRENLYKFFTKDDGIDVGPQYSRPREVVFDRFTPDQILYCIKLFSRDRNAMELIAKYCRNFKQAAGELTIEDLQEVHKLLIVKNVHER